MGRTGSSLCRYNVELHGHEMEICGTVKERAQQSLQRAGSLLVIRRSHSCGTPRWSGTAEGIASRQAQHSTQRVSRNPTRAERRGRLR